MSGSPTTRPGDHRAARGGRRLPRQQRRAERLDGGRMTERRMTRRDALARIGALAGKGPLTRIGVRMVRVPSPASLILRPRARPRRASLRRSAHANSACPTSSAAAASRAYHSTSSAASATTARPIVRAVPSSPRSSWCATAASRDAGRREAHRLGGGRILRRLLRRTRFLLPPGEGGRGAAGWGEVSVYRRPLPTRLASLATLPWRGRIASPFRRFRTVRFQQSP